MYLQSSLATHVSIASLDSSQRMALASFVFNAIIFIVELKRLPVVQHKKKLSKLRTTPRFLVKQP
jgi:hypothetical protein